jgi:hypothetical protein
LLDICHGLLAAAVHINLFEYTGGKAQPKKTGDRTI